MAGAWDVSGKGLRGQMAGLVMLLYLFMGLINQIQAAASIKPNNLLFIIDESARVDDFEMFGGIPGITPSIKRFFSKRGSILVEQMHADYPLCNPSRTSFLLGRSPDTTGVKTNYLDWRTNSEAKSWQSLPRFLKDNGYYTMLGGKVFHHGTVDDTAWSVVYDNSPGIDFKQCQEDPNATKLPLKKGLDMPSLLGCKTTTGNLPDLTLANAAAVELATFASANKPGNQPFALFIGFEVPHMPIRITKQYFQPGDIIFPTIPAQEPPRIASEYQAAYSFDAPMHDVNRLSDSTDQIPNYIKGPNPFKGKGALLPYRQKLRQLHLSGLALVDSACGIILGALETLGYANNTLTVFLTDHGFGYGETRLWEKDIPMDIATRIPLLLNVPWLNASVAHAGPKFFMNAVDLYRTVAGFLQLQGNVASTVQGRDLSSRFVQLHNTSANTTMGPSLVAAFSQVVRCTNPKFCKKTLARTDIVGYTVRTKDYRYIAYFNAIDGQVRNFSHDNLATEELYDHRFDNTTIYNPAGATYVGHEFHNIATQAVFSDVAKELFLLIVKQFQDIPKAERLHTGSIT